jgi:hypothetical protein
MQGGSIRGPGLLSSQGIDFPGKMSLGGASDGGITRHESRIIQGKIDHEGGTSHSGSAQGGFTSRMASSYNDYIVFLGHGIVIFLYIFH